MYEYFKELDKLKEFDVYLRENEFYKQEYKNIYDMKLPITFFEKHKNAFKRMDIIDMFVEGSEESLLYRYPNFLLSYDEFCDIGDFFTKKEEYSVTKGDKNKIDCNSREIEFLFRDYSSYCNYLITMYPKYKEFFIESKKMFKDAIFDIEEIHTIKIEKSKKGVVYRFPDAWYITPNGYLYNTGTGHQQGDLSYPYYSIICYGLRKGYSIPNENLNFKIKEILKRGYVTSFEFSEYAHLIDELPTIQTPEVELANEQYKRIFKMSSKDALKCEMPHFERSYQRNIITLQIGYYAARTSLFNAFVKLNKSKNKRQIIDNIMDLSFDDMLIRFSKFHKISSIVDKTITTSDVRSIEMLKEYLDNGWTLDIVPGIVYDEYKDEISNVDFDSYYISEYLDKQLNQYEGKGKILINNIRKNI